MVEFYDLDESIHGNDENSTSVDLVNNDTEIYINLEYLTSSQSPVVSFVQNSPLAIEGTPTVGVNTMERIPFCSPSLKPKVGMDFTKLEEGVAFYRKYAGVAGFKMRLSSMRLGDGNCIQYKRCVCSKQGESNPTGTKKRRFLNRISCEAKIVFKRLKNGTYTVLKFYEAHNHSLATPNTMVHLTQARQMNILHKKIIVDNSKLNYGPVKSFRMFKEYVNGYGNIGASLQDFKNFTRDIKKYIKQYDAQMIVEIFVQKKAMCSTFYFDFEVDEEGKLTRLFWADPIGIKNYALFGDSFSFDTTFGMNTYRMVFAPFTGVDNHGRCVTFAAGLIVKENEHSFVWLFKNFLKAMGGSFPNCIITDQDLGMKGAIKQVFGSNTKHRYCMWHIMRKLPEKVGPSFKDTDLVKDLCACIWSEDIEPSEFEERWESITSLYGVSDNEWLKDMFEIREAWVPAYFRDLFLGGLLKTTSRSESENSFFGSFTNPHLSLVEFYMRFESAMDAQRWTYSKLVADSKTKKPQCLTPLLLEKQASEFYTLGIFYKFQEEVYGACYKCCLEGMSKNLVEDFEIKDQEKKDKIFKVSFDENEDVLTCSCKKFVYHGYLCRHCIFVLKLKGVERISDTYLLERWGKETKYRASFKDDGRISSDCSVLNNQKNKIGTLWSEIFSCVSLVENSEKHTDELLDLVRGMKEKLINEGVGGSKPKGNKAEMEMLLGTKIPDEVHIMPPRLAKNKGSGKRMLSAKERAIMIENKKRKCGTCGEMASHDTRTCPKSEKNKKKASVVKEK